MCAPNLQYGPNNLKKNISILLYLSVVCEKSGPVAGITFCKFSQLSYPVDYKRVPLHYAVSCCVLALVSKHPND